MVAKMLHYGHLQVLFNQLFISLYPVCMEDLRGYECLRTMLMRGEFEPSVAGRLGRQLAVIHRDTHIGTIGAEALNKLTEEFE